MRSAAGPAAIVPIAPTRSIAQSTAVPYCLECPCASSQSGTNVSRPYQARLRKASGCIEELARLRESGTVRVIDALAVYKDADGELEVEHLSNLSEAEAIEIGSVIGALVGLGIDGEEGAEAGAAAGAQAASEEGVDIFTDDEAWDILEEIPNDSAAALILLEHHWAVPLRDAIARAGGFRISDGFISPLDLVEIGLATAEEARQAELATATR